MWVVFNSYLVIQMLRAAFHSCRVYRHVSLEVLGWLPLNFHQLDLISVSALSNRMCNRIDGSMCGTRFCREKEKKKNECSLQSPKFIRPTEASFSAEIWFHFQNKLFAS